MGSGAVMAATMRSRPEQRGHSNTSTSNTRRMSSGQVSRVRHLVEDLEGG